ncbi:PIN2/TERF1-interacting telomerase inhibitor 1-like [Octopus sinensis]|uniref:PIN2/TERF1-interacting telomerase inhibitor 1-like n=1 Tax=Octopus sinensis TaxID=2607531 RepID=A0A7E6F042_9MOLL|nr:PIN2/TERF1-interacting telomerase inhibitor 1-like [Octopus sinensis]
MLAEKHERVKYSVNPTGSAWSNDESKFGQKMLEKFGWKKGKGLGLREDGCKEHVKVTKKSDSKGLGFKNVFGDNLISHQDDFNSLLSSLSETHTSVSHADTGDVSKLVEKSCVAKRRVHYHKHMKSKDLSGRTAEDMDCIFGRRKIKMKKPETDLVPSSSSPSEVVALEAPNIDAKSESTGDFTINTGKSILEYFAMKMKAMKEAHLQVRGSDSAHKESLVTEPTDLDCSMEVNHCPEQTIKDKSDSTMDVDHCPEEAVKKLKKKKKKKVKDEEFEEEATCELITDVDGEHNSESVDNYKNQSAEMRDECIVVQHKKKKDKHKKCKESTSDVVDCDGENDVSHGETVCSTTGEAKEKKSKKKKKKKKEQGCEVVDSKSVLHNSMVQSPALVNLENQSTVPSCGEQSTAVLNVEIEKDLETRDEDFYTRRKKKKKKRSREEMDNLNQEDSVSAGVSDKVSTEECTAPKSRKHKEKLKKECNVLHETVTEEQTSTVPDETFRSDNSVSNPGKTEDNQQNISLELMCRKDIKHNTEALQSALEHFQLLGANVLDIVGYSF